MAPVVKRHADIGQHCLPYLTGTYTKTMTCLVACLLDRHRLPRLLARRAHTHHHNMHSHGLAYMTIYSTTHSPIPTYTPSLYAQPRSRRLDRNRDTSTMIQPQTASDTNTEPCHTRTITSRVNDSHSERQTHAPVRECESTCTLSLFRVQK